MVGENLEEAGQLVQVVVGTHSKVELLGSKGRACPSRLWSTIVGAMMGFLYFPHPMDVDNVLTRKGSVEWGQPTLLENQQGKEMRERKREVDKRVET